jgi:O-antigen/teichoic acid export membrane protein
VSSDRGASIVTQIRAQLTHNRTVLFNAGSMMSTVLVTALLGAAFWLVAARQFSHDAGGVASAAVAAMTLLGYLATVGLGTLLMGELPRRDRHHRGLLNAALAVSGAIGALIGLGFALLAPLVTPSLEPLSETWVAAVVFALGAGLTGLAGVLDQALIGLMRGALQFKRNVIFSLTKLIALVLVAYLSIDAGGAWIYALLGEMRFDAATHHIYNLSIRAPDLVLPLIVVSLLSAGANADFYIAWMVASFAFMVPVSLSSVLYAVGSGDSAGLHERYRLSVGLSAGLGLIANLVLLVAGGTILSLFGPGYEQHALTTLHILALGVFPETIKAHFLSISRVERRIPQTIPLVIGGMVLELGGALAGGLTGTLALVAAGWLAAVCIEAAVMSRTVFRFLRIGSPGGPPTAVPSDSDDRAGADQHSEMV